MSAFVKCSVCGLLTYPVGGSTVQAGGHGRHLVGIVGQPVAVAVGQDGRALVACLVDQGLDLACTHLFRRGDTAGRYYKCDLRRVSSSAVTDHRVRWPACGQYQQAQP